MKRSPLLRKTPLKRTPFKKSSFSQLKRGKGLKAVSKTRAGWLRQYEDAKALYPVYVRPADKPFVLLHRDEIDFHHPFGRGKERILCFLPITKPKHHNIHHENPNQAYDEGWLQPEYRGRQHDKKHPRPWGTDFETKWPKKYQRQIK